MVERGLEFLCCLGAIDEEKGELTDPLGKWMSEIPVDPMMSKIVSSRSSSPIDWNELMKLQLPSYSY